MYKLITHNSGALRIKFTTNGRQIILLLIGHHSGALRSKFIIFADNTNALLARNKTVPKINKRGVWRTYVNRYP